MWTVHCDLSYRFEWALITRFSPLSASFSLCYFLIVRALHAALLLHHCFTPMCLTTPAPDFWPSLVSISLIHHSYAWYLKKCKNSIYCSKGYVIRRSCLIWGFRLLLPFNSEWYNIPSVSVLHLLRLGLALRGEFSQLWLCALKILSMHCVCLVEMRIFTYWALWSIRKYNENV